MHKIIYTFVSETGVDISDPSELIIGDIYYTLYKDKQHLVLLLIVYDNRTYNMLTLYLKPDGVEVVGKAKLTDDYAPVDDTLKDYIGWIKSLGTPQAKIMLFITTFPGIFITIAITGIIVYLVVRLVRKWRKILVGFKSLIPCGLKGRS